VTIARDNLFFFAPRDSRINLATRIPPVSILARKNLA